MNKFLQPPQQIDNNTIYGKLCEIEKLLKINKGKVQKGVWKIQDVADYCGLDYRHVSNVIMNDPRFPDPIDLKPRTANGRPPKYFLAEEVKAFFSKHRPKNKTKED